MTTSVCTSATAHHGLATHEVVLLETDVHPRPDGREAVERLARSGPNSLPAAKGIGLLMRCSGFVSRQVRSS